MELFIIRHGQSTNNALADDHQATRVYDPALTNTGKRQAEALAAFLATGVSRDPWVNPKTGYSQQDGARGVGITRLYCSAMYRAMQTAQPVAQALGVGAEIWIDIHEHGGIYLEEAGKVTGYSGKSRAEIAAEFPNYAIPDGVKETGWYDPTLGQESVAAMSGRAIKIAAELRRRGQEDHDHRERIAIITHGTFIDALIKALLNQLPSRAMFYLHYNTAITRIDFASDRDRLLVRYMNRIDHLSPDLIT